jgi:hypothetical protein
MWLCESHELGWAGMVVGASGVAASAIAATRMGGVGNTHHRLGLRKNHNVMLAHCQAFVKYYFFSLWITFRCIRRYIARNLLSVCYRFFDEILCDSYKK